MYMYASASVSAQVQFFELRIQDPSRVYMQGWSDPANGKMSCTCVHMFVFSFIQLKPQAQTVNCRNLK